MLGAEEALKHKLVVQEDGDGQGLLGAVVKGWCVMCFGAGGRLGR